MAMAPEALDEYANQEAEAVILSARPEKQLELRALWARLRRKHRAIKSPVASAVLANGAMLDGLYQLQLALTELYAAH